MTGSALASVKKKLCRDLPLQNKRVLVRVDYNVPMDADGNITDDSRIQASLHTLEYLIRVKAKIILIAHLGRPKGKVNLKYSLKPLVKPLEKLTKVPIHFAEDCVGKVAFDAVAKLNPGEILLLENLRFHPEEETGNKVFGKELASLADYFIQDAFGAVHRAHASTSVVPTFIESAAGSLLEKELKFLDTVKSNPVRPYIALLGGAKVSDKIGVVEAFINIVDGIFIGGAMAYTFLKAKGIKVGDSLVENDSISFCQKIISKAKEKNISIILPIDHVIVKDINNPEEATITNGPEIPEGWKGVDIGPQTIEALRPKLKTAKTVFWNGPAGIFEMEPYSKGTMSMAEMASEIAKGGTTVVVGGGDSVAAVKQAGVEKNITYISTGGGASLEFLEGKNLPGVDALPDA